VPSGNQSDVRSHRGTSEPTSSRSSGSGGASSDKPASPGVRVSTASVKVEGRGATGGSRWVDRERKKPVEAKKARRTDWVEPWVTQTIPEDRLPSLDDWQRRIGPLPPMSQGESIPLARPQPAELGAWVRLPQHPFGAALWELIQSEALVHTQAEPALSGYVHAAVLMHREGGLARALASLLANKLASRTLLAMQLATLFLEAYSRDEGLLEAAEADLVAVYDRDAACETYIQPLLFFKGYQALQSYRLAHWLWINGQQEIAKAVQNRMSEVLHVDIHPAAEIGRGVMIDHATGVVVGETARIGDNVSLLHRVTLGGSGTREGRRHPTIGNGVLLGAAVSVLGPVTIGAASKVGAGSVVMTSLPPCCVAVGVPARIVKTNQPPPTDMNQCDFILDYVI